MVAFMLRNPADLRHTYDLNRICSPPHYLRRRTSAQPRPLARRGRSASIQQPAGAQSAGSGRRRDRSGILRAMAHRLVGNGGLEVDDGRSGLRGLWKESTGG